MVFKPKSAAISLTALVFNYIQNDFARSTLKLDYYFQHIVECKYNVQKACSEKI